MLFRLNFFCRAKLDAVDTIESRNRYSKIETYSNIENAPENGHGTACSLQASNKRRREGNVRLRQKKTAANGAKKRTILRLCRRAPTQHEWDMMLKSGEVGLTVEVEEHGKYGTECGDFSTSDLYTANTGGSEELHGHDSSLSMGASILSCIKCGGSRELSTSKVIFV